MSEVSFSRLVAFGDSLTDDGLVFSLSEQVIEVPIPPTSAGYDGRFSNGDVYTIQAAGLLGIEDVETFAIGAAKAVGERTFGDLITGSGLSSILLETPDPTALATDINLGAQVARFLASGPVEPGTAASFLIGANDYNAFVPTSPETAVDEAFALVESVVTTTLQAAGAVATAGVDTLVFNTLPVAAFFPATALASPEIQALGEIVIPAQNDALIAGAAELAPLGVEIKIVDLEFLSAEILADQGTFGFVAPLSAPKLLAVGSSPTIVDTGEGIELVVPTNDALDGLDPDQIAFWDFLHPSEAMHGVLGSFEAASLTHNVVLGGTELGNRSGKDLVLSGGEDDVVAAGRGGDIVLGGLGDDIVRGNKGADILSGGSGDDRLFGGRRGDVIADGAGDDFIAGGKGADVIIDGLGSDVAFGGSGNDTFIFTENFLLGAAPGDNNTFIGKFGTDTLVLALSDETRAAVEAQIETDEAAALASIGITAFGIEEIQFVDREDLGDLDVAARLDEADLWGFV